LVAGGLIYSVSEIAVTQSSATVVKKITWSRGKGKIEDIAMCANGKDAWITSIGPGSLDDLNLYKMTGVDTASPKLTGDHVFFGDNDDFAGEGKGLNGGNGLPAGMGPRGYPGVSVDSSCQFAYVPSFFLDSVVKVDMTVGAAKTAASAQSSDGTVSQNDGTIVWPANYIADHTNSLGDSVIADALRTIPRPVDARLNSDESKVVVSSSKDATVYVLDAATGNILAKIPTGGVGTGSLAVFNTLGLSFNGASIDGANGASFNIGGFDLKYSWTQDGKPVGAVKNGFVIYSMTLNAKADGSWHLSTKDGKSFSQIDEDSPSGANGVHFELQGVKNPVGSYTWTKDGKALGAAQILTTLAVDLDATANAPRAAAIESSRDVACVDLSSNKIAGAVTANPIGGLGINPFMGLASSDGSRLYVSNQGSNSVTVLDGIGCGKSVVATIAVGTAPRHLALSSDNRFLYVANSLDNTVSVIDTGSLKVVNTIQVAAKGEPAPVGELAVSNDNHFLYAFWEGGFKGSPGAAQIWVFDVSGLYK
jgi:YVTN family beta-propeller protein